MTSNSMEAIKLYCGRPPRRGDNLVRHHLKSDTQAALRLQALEDKLTRKTKRPPSGQSVSSTDVFIERILGPRPEEVSLIQPGSPYREKPGGVVDNSEQLVREKNERLHQRARQGELELALVELNCKAVEAASKERDKRTTRLPKRDHNLVVIQGAREWLNLKASRNSEVLSSTEQLVRTQEKVLARISSMRSPARSLAGGSQRSSTAPLVSTDWDFSTAIKKPPVKLLEPGEAPKAEVADVHEVLESIRTKGVHAARPTNALTQTVCAAHLYGRGQLRSKHLQEVTPALHRVITPVATPSTAWLYDPEAGDRFLAEQQAILARMRQREEEEQALRKQREKGKTSSSRLKKKTITPMPTAAGSNDAPKEQSAVGENTTTATEASPRPSETVASESPVTEESPATEAPLPSEPSPELESSIKDDSPTKREKREKKEKKREKKSKRSKDKDKGEEAVENTAISPESSPIRESEKEDRKINLGDLLPKDERSGSESQVNNEQELAEHAEDVPTAENVEAADIDESQDQSHAIIRWSESLLSDHAEFGNLTMHLLDLTAQEMKSRRDLTQLEDDEVYSIVEDYNNGILAAMEADGETLQDEGEAEAGSEVGNLANADPQYADIGSVSSSDPEYEDDLELPSPLKAVAEPEAETSDLASMLGAALRAKGRKPGEELPAQLPPEAIQSAEQEDPPANRTPTFPESLADFYERPGAPDRPEHRSRRGRGSRDRGVDPSRPTTTDSVRPSSRASADQRREDVSSWFDRSPVDSFAQQDVPVEELKAKKSKKKKTKKQSSSAEDDKDEDGFVSIGGVEGSGLDEDVFGNVDQMKSKKTKKGKKGKRSKSGADGSMFDL